MNLVDYLPLLFIAIFYSVRYYIAQCRNQSWNVVNDQDLESDENVEEKRKNQDCTQGGNNHNKKSKDSASKLGGPSGLARLGSRAALSFAFAFLRRAWRNGEDSDLCTDLLQETLEALIMLPPPSLFDESSVSSVWLEVVERTSKFLRSVVMGDVLNQESASSEVEIPAKDRNTALTLLLEFAIQKGKSIFFRFIVLVPISFLMMNSYIYIWCTKDCQRHSLNSIL